MRKSTLIALMAYVLASHAENAMADAKGGDACAKDLTGDGKQIYARTLELKPDKPSIQTTVQQVTRELAHARKISGGVAARDNAIAAGKCVAAFLQ